MPELRSGRRYRKIRADFIARARHINAPCWLCGDNIDYHTHGRTPRSPELDHALPASTHPHLVYEQSNFRVAHAVCNQARGKKPAMHKPLHKPAHNHAERRIKWVPTSW